MLIWVCAGHCGSVGKEDGQFSKGDRTLGLPTLLIVLSLTLKSEAVFSSESW
jgi:hypothetical protein